MTYHTIDDRPERDPRILFDPGEYLTQQELDEFFSESRESLEGGLEC